MEYLSRQEELILLAVYRLEPESSLVNIRRHLNERTDKKWSMSSVYIPLKRLEKSGSLNTTIGEPTSKRGGRAKKFYTITQEGIDSLVKVQNVNNTMWEGINDITQLHKI